MVVTLQHMQLGAQAGITARTEGGIEIAQVTILYRIIPKTRTTKNPAAPMNRGKLGFSLLHVLGAVGRNRLII